MWGFFQVIQDKKYLCLNAINTSIATTLLGNTFGIFSP